MFVLKVVCAWCLKSLGQKTSETDPGGDVSHGMCEDCAAAARASMKQKAA